MWIVTMTQKILTKRKQAWVARRKPEVIRGLPLNPNIAVAERYYQRLKTHIDRMTVDTQKRLERYFKTGHVEEFFADEANAAAQDASVASQARILMTQITDRFTEIFGDIAKPESERMVDAADKSSSLSMHESLKQLSGGMSLQTSVMSGDMNEVVKASVAENVGLIKSIPAQYLQGVNGAVMRSITTGNGLADLVPFLAKHKEITLRRARVIAMDQTRKAYTMLNRGRMEKLGLDKFEWLHTGGSNEPRKLHQQMSGNIYSLSNPPVIDLKTGERGIPGQLINCRCRMLPVITFGDDTQ